MNKTNILFNKYFYVLIFILFLTQSYFYINHISNDYKLLNEYRYIDEVTLLNDKEVLNSEYVNKNLLFNPYEKKKFTSSHNIFSYDKKGSGLNFTNMIDSNILSKHQFKSYGSVLNKYNSSFNSISYSKDMKLLYSDYLNNNNNNNNNNKLYIDGKNIENYFSTYPMFQADSIEKLKEKFNFIKYNVYEQNMQIFDRYYMHENSFMLSPINEMRLDRDKSEIFSQYGFLSISIVDKIMDIYGGFSINSYEKAKKTIDQLYYLIAVVFVLFFFKDNYLRLGFVLLLGIALFGNKYYAFSYAPTVTNSRHLLDLFIILFLYMYGATSKKVYILGTVALSILSIFIAKDFGQFIFLAIIGTLTIPLMVKYLKYKTIDKFSALMLLATIVFGAIAFKYYPMMSNPSIRYFLDGFYSFPFSTNLIFFVVLATIFFQWLLLLTLYEKLEKSKYLYAYIFTLFYTEFLYTYFIWHGSTNNIIIYSYIFVLPFMIIYSLYNFKFKKHLSMIVVFGLFLVYAKTLNSFINQKNDYDDVFKTHKLYKWDHERAGGILTTYSFNGFQDSINLIKKYSSSNEIYMISKYDNILGILSKKYSGFKFFELRSSIVTKNEFDEIKVQINNEAQILFVDNDIERDFDREMAKMSFFDLEPFWRDESLRQRIPKLKVLKKLFQEIKNSYELVEKGELVSVYRRKYD